MTTIRFEPARYFNTIGTHPAALRVPDGATVAVRTVDAHGFDYRGNKPADRPNPMSGPIFVEGAEPGDTLSVTVHDIAMTRGTGWTFNTLAPNVVDPDTVPTYPQREKTHWVIDAAAGRATLADPPPSLARWDVAVEPMIGCFGVAPSMGQAMSTATSGRYGGNMDYRGFKPGVEAMFPVAVEGALFFLGDVHACQSDGEIVGTGIETAAEVTFTVRVRKNTVIGWPRGRNGSKIFAIGNARPLDQALQHATTELHGWLMADYGLDAVAASHVMGQLARYDIANVFNPAYSVACRIDTALLTAITK